MMNPESESPGIEARLRALVEAQSDLVCLMEPDATLVYVNPAGARHLGHASSALIGQSLLDHLHEADRHVMDRLMTEVLASRSDRTCAAALAREGEQRRSFAWTVGVQPDGSRHLLHCVGRVITESRPSRRQTLADLRLVRNVVDNLPLRIAYVDRQLRYRFVNRVQCRRFCREPREIIGLTREEVLGRPTPAAIAQRIDSALEGQAQRFEYIETTDGDTHHIEVQLVPDVAADGHVQGYFYTGLDVTDRARAEQGLRALTDELQRQSDVLRLVTEAIPATVVVVGADGCYRFANRAFEVYCGLPRDRIIGHSATEVLGSAEVDRRKPYMKRALAGEVVSFELDYPGPEGTSWFEFTCIPLRLSGGEVDGFVGIAQDVTQQRRERDRLTMLSQRDPLTRLLNRAGFEQYVEKATQAGRGAALGLLYIDLDHFKPVNDLHGHTVGDHLLQAVAQRLSGLVRPTDAVARLGGDEFAIMLVDVGKLTNAEAVAAKVVAAIEAPFEVDGLVLKIGASVGVAFGARPRGGWGELMQRADAMLYRAKQSGRGRFKG